MSECEKRFGDWGLFNSCRDGLCSLLGVATAVPTPTPTPPTPTPSPTPAPTPEITPEDQAAFRKLGDINNNGVINNEDLDCVSVCYARKVGDPDWMGKCEFADLNGDGRVDMRDMGICSQNQGLTIEEWKGRGTLTYAVPKLLRFNVLSENWRYVLSSFSPALIALGMSFVPLAADVAYKEMQKLGWVK